MALRDVREQRVAKAGGEQRDPHQRVPGSVPTAGSQMKHLAQHSHGLIGRTAVRAHKELRHLRLPPAIDVCGVHAALCRGQVVGLHIADEEPVVAQEQGVVAPPGFSQRGLHLRPDVPMPLGVLVEAVGPDLQREAVPHGGEPLLGDRCAGHRMPCPVAARRGS